MSMQGRLRMAIAPGRTELPENIMSTTMRKLLTVGLLSLCAAGMSAQSQTASPGPPSRNANVDKEDPNKPDTPKHEVPNQEAPGSGNNNDGGAAGTATPSGGDGSSTTTNRDPTQHTQPGMLEKNNAANTARDCEALSDSEKERCEQDVKKQTDTVDRDESSPPVPVTPK